MVINLQVYCKYVCISYVTSVRYVAGINHSALGPHDLFRQRTEHGRDITNLCRHEPVVMAKGAKFRFYPGKNANCEVDISLRGS